MPTIPIEQATAAQLRAFGEIHLGLEIPRTLNAATALAKIKQADPARTEITIEDPTPAASIASPAQVAAMQAQVPLAAEPAVLKAGGAMIHFTADPKVKLRVQKTGDATRAKDVTIGVNGDVWRLQRGQDVEVPYRVYLALENAKEHQAVETGELNAMGVAAKEWQEVYSYPFQVIEMPSKEAIAEWHARTDNAVSSPYAPAKAA